MTAIEVDINARLQAAMKAALKAGEKKELGVIRLMMAAIKQQEIDGRCNLDDAGIIAVLDRMVKQRRDSMSQYRDAGRLDLADVEEYEITVIQDYLPKALSDEEVLQLVEAAVQESGAKSVRDMGKVMGLLKPKMQGRADMAVVSQKVKTVLGSG